MEGKLEMQHTPGIWLSTTTERVIDQTVAHIRHAKLWKICSGTKVNVKRLLEVLIQCWTAAHGWAEGRSIWKDGVTVHEMERAAKIRFMHKVCGASLSICFNVLEFQNRINIVNIISSSQIKAQHSGLERRIIHTAFDHTGAWAPRHMKIAVGLHNAELSSIFRLAQNDTEKHRETITI